MPRPLSISLLAALTAVTAACGPDDNTRFGAPNTLETAAAATPVACSLDDPDLGVTVPAAPDPCPTWEGDVFPLFDADLACTSSVCHGGSTPPELPLGDASATYDNLAAYTRSGRPYIAEDGQDTAYILCNFDGVEGFGARMPIPAADAAARQTVGEWVACGMKKDAGGGGMGGGGAGGPGGGGAGGAGGGL